MAEKLPSIVITGANGQVGRCLHQAASAFRNFDFHFLGREHLPIDNHDLTRRILDAIEPFAVINTAAYTAVDKAETEQETAKSINGYAVGNLAKHCKELGARFVHISTDYVFNGLSNKPYQENDPTDPVNAYGESKLLGEQLALKENAESVIIRTSWVYSQYGHNFLKTMLRLMKERDLVKVVNDQYGSPTNANDLAGCLFQIICANVWSPGIYHYCNKGVINWFQFAEAIREIGQLNQCRVEAITTAEYPTPARRPHFSVLDCHKIQEVWGISLHNWRDSLMQTMGCI